MTSPLGNSTTKHNPIRRMNTTFQKGRRIGMVRHLKLLIKIGNTRRVKRKQKRYSAKHLQIVIHHNQNSKNEITKSEQQNY